MHWLFVPERGDNAGLEEYEQGDLRLVRVRLLVPESSCHTHYTFFPDFFSFFSLWNRETELLAHGTNSK